MEERAEELLQANARVPEGTALSSIQSYLADAVVPSLPFVEEAAHVLGVRASWLAYDDGSPTEEEEAEAKRVAEDLRQSEKRTAAPVLVDVWNALGDGVPGFWRLPHTNRLAVFSGFQRFARSPFVTKEGPTHGTFDSLVERFVRYFRAPFELTEIEEDWLSPVELALLYHGLITAIHTAFWVAEDQGLTDTEDQE